jgi:3-hydroxybutyryl-CoA dehydrogenase
MRGAHTAQALRIIGEGISDFATVDFLARQVGFKLGPLVNGPHALDVLSSSDGVFCHRVLRRGTISPSVITAQRLAGGMLGVNRTKGFYRYTEGKEWKLRKAPPVGNYLQFGFSPSVGDGPELLQLLKPWARISETGQSASQRHLSGATGF